MLKKVYTDGNESNLIYVDGMGEYAPVNEIKKREVDKTELLNFLSVLINLEVIHDPSLVREAKDLVDKHGGSYEE